MASQRGEDTHARGCVPVCRGRGTERGPAGGGENTAPTAAAGTVTGIWGWGGVLRHSQLQCGPRPTFAERDDHDRLQFAGVQ